MPEPRTRRRGARGLFADTRANTAVVFAVAAAALVPAAGVAVDYANLSALRSRLQQTADAAALAGAKEFRLGNADGATIGQVVTNFVSATLGAVATGLTVSPTVDSVAKTVKVVIGEDTSTYVMQVAGASFAHVEVSATAKVVGGAPICVIGLDAGATFTVALDKNARLQAPGCSIYSNSTNSNGLIAKNYATVSAAFICSAGGKSGAGPGSFTPTPQTDCPIIPDPLSARPQPAATGCTNNDLVVSGRTMILMPGTYCGGLTVDLGATVTLSPGVYVFKNGPLSVTGNGTLNGANVGLFFSGAGAVLNLGPLSNVSLTAPKTGDMAGMLVFEDRATPPGQVHQIRSNNARMLLGTIYLPQNRLHVAALNPIADQSAYTIVVARMFTLSEGPTMVLNTNYSGTNIPVPTGVGPNANQTMLTD